MNCSPWKSEKRPVGIQRQVVDVVRIEKLFSKLCFFFKAEPLTQCKFNCNSVNFLMEQLRGISVPIKNSKYKFELEWYLK